MILWDEDYKWDIDFSGNPELSDRFAYLRTQVFKGLEHKFYANTQVFKNTEAHAFSDARKIAFGAVLYLVTPHCVECLGGHIQLIKAKGKLTTPTKEQSPKEDTVPRW